MERQGHDYERQLRLLRERVEHEEASKKRLQEELETISASRSSNEERITEQRAAHEEMVKELREEFNRQLEAILTEHKKELEEEKNATRVALDAVHRMHEEEVRVLNERLRSIQQRATQLEQQKSAVETLNRTEGSSQCE